MFELRTILKFRKTISLVVTPLALIPIAFAQDSSEEMRCAYVALVMALYWVTEALPLPVTSLIPMVAFPLLGIMSTSEVSINYLKSTNFMFLGGLILALAIEYSNLHQRLGLKIMYHVGSSQKFILLGFMVTTGFLSMWISNTAATAMMLPIVDAIADVLAEQAEEDQASNESSELIEENKTSKKLSVETEHQLQRQKNIMLLSVAYAANIGGTGVIPGSPTNFVVPQVLNGRFGISHGLTFASWMGFCIPLMILNIFLLWIWLQIFTWRPRRIQSSEDISQETKAEAKSKEKRVKEVIGHKYDALGPITTHEILTLICFTSVILLWFFQKPLFIKGWADFFVFETARGKTVHVGSATPAILLVIVLFALPINFKFWPFQSKSQSAESSPSLINWKLIETKLPWGVIFLLGGGLALSDACDKSGLSQWIVSKLMSLKELSPWIINITVSIITAALTQIASNTAVANVILPILTDMSLTICQNPIYLVLTAALSCSYAFMLPVGTPSNAIVFGASTMSVLDMILPGVGMNIITLVTTTVAINSYGIPIFGLDTFPEWAIATLPENSTCIQNP